ncbi:MULTISPECIES: hypothetical protein [unclassified Sphingomonas]|uniref:hypothetical protein n=1 Tax=unclassified Sphingomonas TaxID=196159 RepID=UPI0006FF53C5|nr:MULTISPECIES: hypothetical protein [unclassified Sphingomonas]KQN21071.1 hypothetical protein ASE89_16750 [Sphingomonas sp. Leaf30]MBD8550612.1 hypothetical protein [Sphingomonas sp. CFBP 8764]
MRHNQSLPAAYALLAILGVAVWVRILSAHGGLWVDEAWSAVLVARADTPWAVFTSINHDNNHHLNSLWMQAVGYATPPLALRALSIVTGAATVLVVAAIGARRSAAHALVGAALFALSPILVNYGSEARGYAPMLLCALGAILVAARWLDAPASAPRHAPGLLALLTIFGLLSQLTMLFFVVAIAGWVALTLRQRVATGTAAAMTARLMLPSVVAVMLVFTLVFGAAAASPGGMQVGDYVPFSFASLASALQVMLATTLGASALPRWWIAVLALTLCVAAMAAVAQRRPVAWLAMLAIAGLPIALATLHIANTGMPRYFLLSSVAILLLLTDLIATALTKGPRSRMLAALALTLLAIGMNHDITQDIARRRGDIDAAIARVRIEAPGGARVHVDHLQPVAPLRVAAATARYPLVLTGNCRPVQFVFVDLDDGGAAAATTRRCGRVYTLRTVRRRGMLSGTDWALYGLPRARNALATNPY